MKRKTDLKGLTRGIVFTGILSLALALTGSAWAFPSQRDKRSGPQHRNERRAPQHRVDRRAPQHRVERRAPHYPRYGARVRSLPSGHRDMWVGKSRYYYHQGLFYRRGLSGFIVVRPPIGAVVLDLPFGFLRLLIGGSTYYTYGGVYYQSGPSGYMVVEAPPQVGVQAPPAVVEAPGAVHGRITVITDKLNVRAGPGLDRQVITQVYRGDVLDVKGDAGGWWYVQTPDGRHGWVMSRYTTTPVSVPANG